MIIVSEKQYGNIKMNRQHFVLDEKRRKRKKNEKKTYELTEKTNIGNASTAFFDRFRH